MKFGQPIRLLELFGGIGACSAAFKRLGIPYVIADYVEIDKYAVKSYNAMHGTHFEPQDITQWDKDIEVDFIMHGSPCQDFSIAGLGAGGDKGSGTRSSLMYETVRIVEKLRPKYVLWENVANILSDKHRHNFDAYWETMETLGYVNQSWKLNAKDYGIPQNRVRVFTLSILKEHWKPSFFLPPHRQQLKVFLGDLLENNVDEKYYLSDTALKTISNELPKRQSYITKKYAQFLMRKGYVPELFNPYNCREIKTVAPTMSTQCGSTTSSSTVLKIESTKIIASKYNHPSIAKLHKQLSTIEPKILRYERTEYAKQIRKQYEAGKINERRCNLRQYTTRNDGCTNTLTTVQKDNYLLDQTLRIRKLTPRECWRLMGFSDEQFKLAASVNSDTQLYKQAGNSIVVDVLIAILHELFSE